MDTLTTVLIAIPVLILFRCYLLIIDAVGQSVSDKLTAHRTHKSNQRKARKLGFYDLYQERISHYHPITESASRQAFFHAGTKHFENKGDLTK